MMADRNYQFAKGFPTLRDRATILRSGFPRTRGDRPYYGRVQTRVLQGSPARAGIDRKRRRPRSPGRRFPRTRGDRPWPRLRLRVRGSPARAGIAISQSIQIRPMTTSQNRNARKRNLPNQTQHALRHVKSQNPRPLPQSQKHPRSRSAYVSPPRNGRNAPRHALLKHATR